MVLVTILKYLFAHIRPSFLLHNKFTIEPFLVTCVNSIFAKLIKSRNINFHLNVNVLRTLKGK